MSDHIYGFKSDSKVIIIKSIFVLIILTVLGCSNRMSTSNQPPVINIISPTSGARFEVNQPINLSCLAFDPEDGTLSGKSVLWSSSISGILGTGNNLTLTNLPIGTHTITARAIDSDGALSTAKVTITISTGPNPPLMTGPARGEVGASLSFTIGPFLTSIKSVTVDWGDGTSIGPISVSGASIRISHTWLSPGNYTISTIVTDVWGSRTSAPVHNIIIYGTSTPTAPIISGPTSGNAGTQYTFNIGPFSSTVTSITINWGDGTTTGPISVTGSPITITHTWLSPGSYTISISVTDIHGTSSFIPVSTIYIYGSSVPVSPPMGGPTIGKVGKQYTFNIGPFSLASNKTIEIDWGDGTIIGPVNVSSSFMSFTHTWLTANVAPYLIKARIDDGMGSSAWIVVHSIRIANSDELNVPQISGPGKGRIFIQYNFTIGPFSTGTRTIEINWGDGTTTGPVAVVPSYMTFSHIWTRRNLRGYTISVRVADDNGTSPFINVFRIIIF